MFSWLQKKKKKRRGEGQTRGRFPHLSFLDIYYKNQQIYLWVQYHFSWFMFGLHLVKPQGFKKSFFHKEIRLWKCDHEK